MLTEITMLRPKVGDNRSQLEQIENINRSKQFPGQIELPYSKEVKISSEFIPEAKQTVIRYGRDEDWKMVNLGTKTNFISLIPPSKEESEENCISRRVFEIVHQVSDLRTTLKLKSNNNKIEITGSKPKRTLENLGSVILLEPGDVVTVLANRIPVFRYTFQPKNIPNPDLEALKKSTGIEFDKYPDQELICIPETNIQKFIEDFPELATRPIAEFLDSPLDLFDVQSLKSQEEVRLIKTNQNNGTLVCPTTSNYQPDFKAHRVLVDGGGVSSIPRDQDAEQIIKLYNENHQALKMSAGAGFGILDCHCGNDGRTWRIIENTGSEAISAYDCTKEGEDAIRVIEPNTCAVFAGVCILKVSEGKYLKLSHDTHRLISDDNAQKVRALTGFLPKEIAQFLKDKPTTTEFDPKDIQKSNSVILSSEDRQAEIDKVEVEMGMKVRSAPKTATFQRTATNDMAGFKNWRIATINCPKQATECLTGINALMERAKIWVTNNVNIANSETLNTNQLPQLLAGDGSFAFFTQENIALESSREDASINELDGLSKLFMIPYFHQVVFEYIIGKISRQNLNRNYLPKDSLLKGFFDSNSDLIKSCRINYRTIQDFCPNLGGLSMRYGVCRSVDMLEPLPRNLEYRNDPRTTNTNDYIDQTPRPATVVTVDLSQGSAKEAEKNSSADTYFNLGMPWRDYSAYKTTIADILLQRNDSGLKDQIDWLFRDFESAQYYRNPAAELVVGPTKRTKIKFDIMVTAADRIYKLTQDVTKVLFSESNKT